MYVDKVPGFVNFRLTSEMILPQQVWQGFIEDVKKELPSHARDYDPKTYTWTVNEAGWKTVCQLRKKWFMDERQVNLEL